MREALGFALLFGGIYAALYPDHAGQTVGRFIAALIRAASGV